MPRQSDPLDDRTPLDAPRLNVAVRVGWLLRTHRTVQGLSLRQMANGLAELGVHISAATLSRVESEGQRTPAVVDGYTAVLGLPEGSLRSLVDAICRGFPYAPPAPADTRPQTLDTFSTAYDEVSGDRPTGGAWLRFARHHTGSSGYGLPLAMMGPLLERLADESGRCPPPGHTARHEALSILIDSPYGALTTDVLRAKIEEPDHQAFFHLTSVLSDHPERGTLAWAAGLLSADDLFQVRGASYLLQGALVRGGSDLATWLDLVPTLAEAWRGSRDTGARATAVDAVLTVLPPPVQDALRHDGVTVARLAPTVEFSRTRDNPHYRLATEIARATRQRMDHPEEPLLERLVFEACFEPRGVRMATAGWWLSGSPFAPALVATLLAHERWPDRGSRAAGLQLAMICHTGTDVDTRRLLAGDDQDLVRAATIIGRSGGRLPDDALARGLAGDETVQRATTYCLGMAGDPRLAALAQDETLPPAITRGARWWLEKGPRVVE